jgi:hypothetical protein
VGVGRRRTISLSTTSSTSRHGPGGFRMRSITSVEAADPSAGSRTWPSGSRISESRHCTGDRAHGRGKGDPCHTCVLSSRGGRGGNFHRSEWTPKTDPLKQMPPRRQRSRNSSLVGDRLSVWDRERQWFS